MTERATPSQIAYIHALHERLGISLAAFAVALRRGYGVLIPLSLTQAQAAAVVYRLRRIDYGLLPLPEDARELFTYPWLTGMDAA